MLQLRGAWVNVNDGTIHPVLLNGVLDAQDAQESTRTT